MRFHIEEYTDAKYLEILKDEWHNLCETCIYCTPFQYPQWIIPWWKHFGGSDLKVVSDS